MITKHPGTGGLVSVGTVTAQLLYEIGGPAYLGPDVTARFDTIALAPGRRAPGRDHRGAGRARRPPTLKVALNDVGGFRNTMTLVLTGLDIEAKAARAEELLFAVLGGKERFAEVDVRLLRFDRPDAPTNEQATAHLRITVKDPDPRKVGRAFSNATMELALGGYAGFHTTTPPTARVGVRRLLARGGAALGRQHTVVLPGGERRVIADPPTGRGRRSAAPSPRAARSPVAGPRPGAARAGRGRAVGRQGRQRQHRALGARRRGLRLAGARSSPPTGCASCSDPRPRRCRSTSTRCPTCAR